MIKNLKAKILSLSFIRIKIKINKIIYIFVFNIQFVIFSENLYKFLVQPYADAVLENLDRRLIYTALHEAFLTYLKVAFFASLFISSPIFLTQIWKFIAPGLYSNEKSFTSLFNCNPVLFIFGGMLVYYFIMPLAIKFF